MRRRERRAVPVDDKMAMIKKVGVIGSGQMGNGIAHVAALAGFDVVLNDVSVDRLKSAMATINGNLSRQVAKKIIADDERNQALSRIMLTDTYDGLADCDLVIESAVEKEEVKRKIFHDLCAVLKGDALIASNTSSISITRLAATTDRPERFIGIHFMNPVPLMELVELIRGIATDDSTFEASKEFVTTLGKQIAVSEDFPAFIVNRILLPMINEAIYTLYEGVGNVEAIDAAMKLGAHHPMAPLERVGRNHLDDLGHLHHVEKCCDARHHVLEARGRGRDEGVIAGSQCHDQRGQRLGEVVRIRAGRACDGIAGIRISPTRQECADRKPLYDRGGCKQSRSGGALDVRRLSGKFPDRAENQGRKGVAGLRDRDDEWDHARHLVADKLALGDQRRQPGSVAESDAEQRHAEQQERHACAVGGDEGNAAHHLDQVTDRGQQPAVDRRGHGPADQRASGNGHQRDPSHRQTRIGRAKRGDQQRIEMHGQTDLREKPQRHPPGKRHEFAIRPERPSGQRSRGG